MSYNGGKGQVFRQVINQMPPHRVYVEGFLGHGAVMRNKKPAQFNYGLDLDGDVLPVVRDSVLGIGAENHFHLMRANVLEWMPEQAELLADRETLVYLDPPYLRDTRSSARDLYKFEMTENDHWRMLQMAKRLSCMVAISGYWSSLYASELIGWRTISFQAVKRSGEVATEFLWMNYPPPMELHDYRWLGDNRRERERLKRIKQRWSARLAKVDPLERYALMEALRDAARQSP